MNAEMNGDAHPTSPSLGSVALPQALDLVDSPVGNASEPRMPEQHHFATQSFRTPVNASPSFPGVAVVENAPAKAFPSYLKNGVPRKGRSSRSLQMDIETKESSDKPKEKPNHEERMKNLRKAVKNLKQDAWRYPSIYQLLGLN